MKAGMTIKALFGLGLAVFLACAAAGCGRRGDGYLDRLLDLDSYGFKGRKPPLNTVEDLKKAIEANRAEVERKVEAAQNLGVYYKMLAMKYIDSEMYGLSLEALDGAIAIYPENPQLFYYAGISSARMAKAEVVKPKEAADLLSRAEAYYKRAIALDPAYVNAMYGLAVLYALELDRPEAAESLLDRVLLREKKNLDAMFLLARIYYQMGRPGEALELYKKITDTNPPEKIRNQAEANKKKIEEELYDRSK